MRSLSVLLLAASNSPNTDSLVRTWTALGHRVHIVTFHGGGDISTPIDRLQSKLGKVGYAFQAARIRAIASAFRPDVVVAYHITSYGLAAATTGLHPMVAVAAGGDILPEQYGSQIRAVIMPLVARWALRRSDFVFSWASHMTDRLVALGADPRRILTLPRGVDTDVFRPASRFAVPGDELRLASTRSLKKVYQIDRLIEAVAVLAATGERARVTVIGEGPERGGLEQLRDARGLTTQVDFAGMLPKVRVAEHLRASHAYVSLTRSDGVSASLLEAMATGIVPIVSDIAANRDWVTDGDNGLLVEPADARAVADAIRRAGSDQALRDRCYVHNPRLIAAKASAPLNGALMAEQLAELAARGQRPTPGLVVSARAN